VASLWVDETKAKTFIFVAVELPANELPEIRKRLISHLLPGQRSIHFAKESDRRRKALLKSWLPMMAQAHIFDSNQKNSKLARQQSLRRLVQDLRPDFMCLELDESSRSSDLEVLHEMRSKLKVLKHDFSFRLELSHIEPLLWLPDALGWAYQRGGEYRFVRQYLKSKREPE
jgi:hypothetical protein